MIKPNKWQLTIVLTIGILGVSLAAIWIRLAVDLVSPDNKVGLGLFLAASRLIVAALILLPNWNNFRLVQIKSTAFVYAIAAGVCLAVHFATWITSLSYTSIAASTVLVTTNPIWVGLFSWWWYKQKLTWGNIIGIAIASIGGIVMTTADPGAVGNYSNSTLGNTLALIGAIMSSLYIIFGSQAQRRGLSIGHYIAIAYSTAALCLLPLPLLYKTSYLGYAPLVYLYIFLMALMSQVIGHTSLNWAVRWISPTLVSLSLLFEPVVASLVGAVVFEEIPTISILLGGVIILAGVVVFLQPFSAQ